MTAVIEKLQLFRRHICQSTKTEKRALLIGQSLMEARTPYIPIAELLFVPHILLCVMLYGQNILNVCIEMFKIQHEFCIPILLK